MMDRRLSIALVVIGMGFLACGRSQDFDSLGSSPNRIAQGHDSGDAAPRIPNKSTETAEPLAEGKPGDVDTPQQVAGVFLHCADDMTLEVAGSPNKVAGCRLQDETGAKITRSNLYSFAYDVVKADKSKLSSAEQALVSVSSIPDESFPWHWVISYGRSLPVLAFSLTLTEIATGRSSAPITAIITATSFEFTGQAMSLQRVSIGGSTGTAQLVLAPSALQTYLVPTFIPLETNDEFDFSKIEFSFSFQENGDPNAEKTTCTYQGRDPLFDRIFGSPSTELKARFKDCVGPKRLRSGDPFTTRKLDLRLRFNGSGGDPIPSVVFRGMEFEAVTEKKP